MIHQVKRLPQAGWLLQDILSLQVAVIEAATQYSFSPDAAEDLKVFTASFTPVLQKFLETQEDFSARAEDIANWVMNTKSKGIRTILVKPLSQFAKATQAEKEQLLSKIRSDINLLYQPEAASLKFAILEKESSIWEKGAGDFLYAFYDLWSNGFPACAFSLSNTKYKRQDFVQEFVKENSDLFICAICDGSAYIGRRKDHIFTSIDHFFPRSIYPHLSCHPLNLIPICSFCNSYIKGNEDPMKLNGQPIPLTDFILPYQDMKSALCTNAFIAVANRKPRGDRKRHPMQLELRAAREFTAGNRIAAFNHLYKIDERWSEGMDEIEDHVFRRITQYLTLIDPVNQSIKPQALVQYLKALMAQTDMENIGKDPYAFPMVWLLNSYIDQLENQEKGGENASIYIALKNWSDSNRRRWAQLEEHSKKIRQRVP